MTNLKPSETNILLVEDEESLLKLATHILEMQGYRVIASPHSEAAMRTAKNLPDRIHLLLTDVRMDPHMSGCKLAQHLRVLRPEMQVLYMSAFPASEIVVREVGHGTADLLKKPFTPTGLLEAVKKSLEHAEARQNH
ncbi:MAG: hybrid sensor histidine kinase/response regulator [Fibrobacteres bacterium]|nr:hybrid sensor histidine kinase/response regulator [Fibrobacterota bacterium]